MRSFGKFALAGVSLMAISAPAFAQNAAAPAGEGADDDVIEVIGTLIRGTEAVGSQTINVDQGDIAAKGAGTTNELLGTIPQLAATFNGRVEVSPNGFSTGTNSTNKPNLRSLPASGSGVTTLVLLDGIRLTPVGVNDAAVDVDIIPTQVLAGVDAVTDGGSSLYGADAVGGVLNFRTMKTYEGLKLDFNYGFGTKLTSHRTWDGSITAGHSWSTGNAYVSVSHYDRNGVVNGEVPWHSSKVYSVADPNGSFNGTTCINWVGSNVNYFSTGTGYTSNPAAPGAGRVPVGTPCDQQSSASYTPDMKRTNVFASFSQEFSDTVSLRVTGYWAKRNMSFKAYPLGGSTADDLAPTQLTDPNPLGVIVQRPGGTGFSFGANANYVNRDSTLGFQTWGISPELTVKVGGDWQVKASMHYGRSTNRYRLPGVNDIKMSCYISGLDPNGVPCPGIAGGQLIPKNVALASAAVVNDITNFETATDTNQQLFLARVVADGTVFSLPAGDVKVALGAEYQRNSAQTRSDLGTFGSIDARPWRSFTRDSKSLFGEIHVPLVANDEWKVLEVAASARYDHYSEFGGTINPNFGATFKPAPWLKIYSHWGTSFNAPSALDDIGLGSGRVATSTIYVINGTAGTQRPNDPLGRDPYPANPINGATICPALPAAQPPGCVPLGSKLGTRSVVITGSKPLELQPQTAKSFAVGFEATPLPGLNFGAEIYAINFNNVIGTINPANLNVYLTNPKNFIYNSELSQARWEALLAELGNGQAIKAQQPLASNIALVVDARTSNLNSAQIRGVDFHVTYDHDFDFGHMQFGINGNVPTRALVTTPEATTEEVGHLNPEYTLSNWVEWSKDRWTVKATVNISGPFDGATPNYLNQVEKTSPFVLTNLFIGYKIKDSSGPLNGLALRLNIDNLFDKEPSRIKLASTNFPSYNNWTLGRVIKLGISKEF